MESYLYASSLREFLRGRRLFPWLLLALAGMLLAFVWHYLDRLSSDVDRYTAVSQMLVFHVLALSSAIFSTAIVSQEVEQKTIVYLLTRPVTRWKLLLARYCASATVVSVLGILGAFLVSFGIYQGHPFTNTLLWRDVMSLIFGAFAYGALFLMVSLLINRAMIVCLLFAFGWETIVPKMPGEMYRLSIYSHILAIADHPSTQSNNPLVNLITGTFSANTITPAGAYITLFAVTVILTALSAAWFTHFEYVPREDAE